MDQAAPVQANLAPMLAAARDVQTLLVAIADRPSRLAEHHITPGQVVVLRSGAGLAAVADDAVTAIYDAVATLDEGFELLTFYVGDGGTEEEARAAVDRISERRPGTEAEFLPGGQPHYRYVISAE
jgi:dihydroxyacetone kinase-like predicted kinase